ncbi:S8 family serine peptidase [Shewanella sp. SHSM-M6]|uniref:S8 family serine peptidase n=2 Tax=Shewanella salipaludis TaxID=2723052 RepID=A0A972FUM0_9GAMM|nr:S8 family serine peptidase [Shewanella salipaludis]NMH65952.1 S8 family serine peptidase [Shewanella salipaludis]
MSVEAASQLEVSISKPNLKSGFITAMHSKGFAQDLNAGHSAVFTPEVNLPSGTYRYFVRLLESPVALYQGGIEGYQATSSDVVKGKSRKLDVNSQNVKSYRSFLNKRQDSVIQKATALLGELNVKQRTTLAYNGMVIEMTQAQATKLASVPGIAHINREILRKPMSDSGPAIIKAPTVWNGEATGVESKGEGMIVGIIDTGINTDHPSFADIGGDGYDHTNPWGPGVYSGDCAGDFPGLCNDKLIGVHSWPAVTDGYLDHDIDVPANGEDHNGHGSHTASTVAGNVLIDQAIVDAEGGNTDIKFARMSGVAPHANIVAYQVCVPGEDDAIGFNGCLPSLTVLAVEDAIEHGIDALNYSIGGGSSDPWNDADALAFLAARKAGIHVATSAGNSGPGPETVGSPGDAPWITTVAAYTHDRDFSEKTLDGFTGGDTAAPTKITGKSISGAFTGSIVYAGDFENPNDPEGDPAQCLKKFPENTFAPNTIVVCDRGAIARTAKGINVKAGGAAALVLANVQGGANSVVADAHVLPAINIDADQGDTLRAWLASGKGHTASISGTEVVHDDKLARVAAEFTSRGPNKSVPDVIAPSIAAPGVSIYAAYADSQSAAFKEFPDPSNFAFLSGTSMASPHVAGALTLLASIHPEWTPAEIQSALMLTANQKTLKDDGKTPSDFFDMGAGFADIEAAAKTGLVMDETYVDYVKADPALGGQPSQINLPTMANAKCVDTCTWTRTVKATKAGSWTASTLGVADGLVLTVTPASFELAEGATQELTVTANVAAASEGWNFANIKLAAEGMPEVKLPVAVMANGDNLPGSIDIVAGRTVGSMTYSGFVAKDLTNIKAGIYDKSSNVIAPQVLSVPEDGYDGIALTFSEVVPNIKFSTSSETAPDVDLRIVRHYGVDDDELVGSSAGPDSNESVAFTNLPAGTYYVLVDGYKASTPGGSDDVLLSVTSVLPTADSLSDTASVKVKEEAGKFSLTFDWDTDKNANGILILESGDMSAMKQVPFSITRKDEVTQIANLSDSMVAGEANRVSFEVAANFTDADKEYLFTAQMSAGHKVENISNGGVQEGNTITWTVVQKADSGENLSVGFDLVPTKAGDAFALKLTDELDGDMVEKTYKFGVMEVAPVANISAPTAVQELQDVVVNGTLSSDGNDDALTYKWVQTAGKVVATDTSGGNLSFKAPEVGEGGDVLSFNLTVTDTQGNSDTQSVSIAVSDKPSDDGGALGWLSLLLVPFAWTRRKLKA